MAVPRRARHHVLKQSSALQEPIRGEKPLLWGETRSWRTQLAVTRGQRGRAAWPPLSRAISVVQRPQLTGRGLQTPRRWPQFWANSGGGVGTLNQAGLQRAFDWVRPSLPRNSRVSLGKMHPLGRCTPEGSPRAVNDFLVPPPTTFSSRHVPLRQFQRGHGLTASGARPPPTRHTG